MAKKNNQKMIIDTTSTNLVCTEIPIQISDEKLKSILSKTYEKARKDANKFKIYKHFGIFLSVALTLLMTLITSDFKPLGKINGNILQIICVVFCCASFLAGFVFVILFAMRKDANALDERDTTISEIMDNLK